MLRYVSIVIASMLVLSSAAQAARDVTTPGDTIIGVPNDGITTGGNNNGWQPYELPSFAIDDQILTKYRHFKGRFEPTGIQVTPSVGPTIVTGLTLTTANDAKVRDPVEYELYGSNDSINGPYTLIASGPIVDFAGKAWPRRTKNDTPITFANDVAYAHYQLMFPVVRGAVANGMQIAEIELLGLVFKATDPVPADGAVLADTLANITWTAGDFAVSHDVYLGDNFDDVNDGTGDTFRGNLADLMLIARFAFPDALVPGTTYYWRIDEVNYAYRNSPWKGDVWSFVISPRNAYNLVPADGTKFLDPNLTLNWSAGFEAKLHQVYFGDDAAEVEAGGATFKGALAEPTFAPGTLALGKTYYWRIDEFDGFATHKGEIASFTIKPDIPITDPDLICWWQLDEGQGTNVLDWSGHGNDATFTGQPEWVEGLDGTGLNFDRPNEHVIANFTDQTWSAFALTVWIRANTLGQKSDSSITATYSSTNANGFQICFNSRNRYRYHASNVNFIMGPASTSWVHLAVSYDGVVASAYYNGELVGTFTPEDVDLVANKFAIGVNREEDSGFDGVVEDYRVYSKPLTQEEIQLVMRIDPLSAWDESPMNASNPDIDAVTPLSWSAGDNASSHEVYFGLDKDAVATADTSDTTGVYRGSQAGTSFTPAEGVEWGGGPYYWRIDESNNDGTVTEGRVWSFTVADFILIDDFESYTDDHADNEAIWQTWADGFGVPTNGSRVGYVHRPYAEQTIVNGGLQSMPLLYDNTASMSNSEAVLGLTASHNWTNHGVEVLSLWFRGRPASVGSFTEGPAGTYTMTGSVTQILGQMDEFHYAYKTLTGAGSIVARVDSVEKTNPWAKAGVMIRETLYPGSKYVFGCVAPGNFIAFQGRLVTDGNQETRFEVSQGNITAPHWVKLERDMADNFTMSHSADGLAWEPVLDATSQNIRKMSSDVCVGLAVTATNTAAACEAVFSNVTITGMVSPEWGNQDIGVASNAVEPLYVALSNSDGTSAVVVNGDANASVTDVWTEWLIDLSEFANQGVNLANVYKIAIGLGTTGDPAATGGSGTMFIDDIVLLRPAQEP